MNYTISPYMIFMFDSNFCINDLYICVFFFTFAKKWLTMLIGFIFSILTATYTLSSNNTVKQDGEVPTYSQYHYERSSTTGQKGQMTSGNTTCLRLSGWDGCMVRSVRLEMHSNSKSGAGSLKMKVGKNIVWEIQDAPFSSDDWAGKYSSEWVNISQTMEVTVGNHEAIEILITAMENSLYINRYTIEYEAAPPTCYTVSFVTGMDSVPASVTQGTIGGSIVLPEWRDIAGWYFQGWSEVDIVGDTVAQVWMAAGSEYVPRTNTYLWAVYSDVEEVAAVSDYVSGQYVLAMWNATTEYFADSGMAMAGEVKSGEVALCATNMMRNKKGRCCLLTTIEDEMIYELEFGADSTVAITHMQSEMPIGYKNDKLYGTSDGLWQYKVLGDSSLVLYFAGDDLTDTHVLYFGVSATSEEKQAIAKAQRLDISRWEKDGLWLFPVVYPRYTSWPFGKPDIEDDEEEGDVSSVLSDGQYIMNIGRYRLYVKDGKKYLFL